MCVCVRLNTRRKLEDGLSYNKRAGGQATLSLWVALGEVGEMSRLNL